MSREDWLVLATAVVIGITAYGILVEGWFL